MKTFEFPQAPAAAQQERAKPVSSNAKPFFGGFNQKTKSSVASRSKQQELEKEAKLKQYREIVGSQQQQQQPAVSDGRRKAAANEWMIDQALRKTNVPSQTLMSVEIVKRQDEEQFGNDKGTQSNVLNRRPMTAKPHSGNPVAVKQLIFNTGGEDLAQQVEQAMTVAVAAPGTAQRQRPIKKDGGGQTLHTMNTQNKTKAQFDKQKTIYQSQYHFEDDFTIQKEPSLVVQGAELHILPGDQYPGGPNCKHHGVLPNAGVGSYCATGGMQPKAMPSTISTKGNAKRYYKGYQQKLQQHQQEKESHYKSLYGESDEKKENEDKNKHNVKRRSRPQTAKTLVPGTVSKRPISSYKNIRDLDRLETLERQRSTKNLEHIYGRSEKLDEYAQDKLMQKKREETKAELKHLLNRYVKTTDHNTLCAQRVGLAQQEMGIMHNKMDSALAKIQTYENQFQKTKYEALELNSYLQKDNFIASEFEKNLERNLREARIGWTGGSAAGEISINDKLRGLSHLFEDPSRMPYYDEKLGQWQLSQKFSLEEETGESIQLRHPFFDQ